MSCNAWNHPVGCNCGWGGAYYEADTSTYQNHWNITKSYTTPNALCQLCGAKLFFYKSPLGGRVYFDHLGPPWPKHSCITVKVDKNLSSSDHRIAMTARPEKTHDWAPFVFRDILRHDSDVVEIITEPGSLKEIPHSIFLKSARLSSSKNCPYFIRKSNFRDEFEISTLDVSAREPSEIRFIAATSINSLNLIGQRPSEGVNFKRFSTRFPSNKLTPVSDLLCELGDMGIYPGEIRSKAYDLARKEILKRHAGFPQVTIVKVLVSDDPLMRVNYLVRELVEKYWLSNKYYFIIDVLIEAFPDAGEIYDECTRTPYTAITVNNLNIRNMSDFRKVNARKSDVFKMLEIAYCCNGINAHITRAIHEFIDSVRSYENMARRFADELVKLSPRSV